MEMWKKAVVGGGVAVVVVAAIVVAGYLTGCLDTPYVTSIENGWGNVSENETELMTSVTVENPNPFDVTISSLHYTIRMNNITMAEGRDHEITLKGGTTVVDYVSSVNMSRIPRWWSSHVTHGETTRIELVYTVKAKAGLIHRSQTNTETYGTVHTTLLSTLRLNQPRIIKVSLNGEDHRLLIAADFAARWGSITGETTIINATVDLYNPHDSPIAVNAFTYHFRMNNLTVGYGYLDSAVTLPPYETTSVVCDTVINNSHLAGWFATHIQNNETTRYAIGSSATFTFNGHRHTVEPVHLTGDFSTDLLD